MSGDKDVGLFLEWVIGCSTGANSVHAVTDELLAYTSGNVGILYWTEERRQVLLRGHVSVDLSPPESAPRRCQLPLRHPGSSATHDLTLQLCPAVIDSLHDTCSATQSRHALSLLIGDCSSPLALAALGRHSSSGRRPPAMHLPRWRSRIRKALLRWQYLPTRSCWPPCLLRTQSP